ncbi:MAG: tRNA threonylcarbamoyladenosine dehydratase [Clostridiales bacterium]|nr:tRNA threonylcarbamoyladenosine dehydratase [Clostridiales bacterium]
MLHAFSRTEMLLGAEALQKLKESRVAIFGIGGVGSYAAEGLARAGVGKFMLVDDDCVCLTNINRQIHATMKTIGKPKVEVMRDRILEINPKAEVECRQMFYLPENAGEIMNEHFDYIIDAIDTVTAKIDLVMRAKADDIPIICSMGTGNKLDPTKLEVIDISKTSVDPLARVMRKELRDRGIIHLKVLFSKEEPLKTLETDQTDCRQNCVCPAGTTRKCTVRHHIPGSVSFVPPVAGLIIAGEVVKDITGINKKKNGG